MKFLFAILGFFMLYMSCLPCGDGKECSIMTEVNVSAINSHAEHNHNTETCTPFCTCSCCAVSTFFSYTSEKLTVKPVLQSVKFPLFNFALHTEAYFNIWQPPQLS